MMGAMKTRWIRVGLVIFVTLFPCHLVTLSSKAVAQIVVIDDVILLTSRQKKMLESRIHQHLDLPGGAYRLSPGPGADTPRLGEERISVATVPGLLSDERPRAMQDGARLRLAPLPSLRSEGLPQYGVLELPAKEEEGPEDGLTLDAAIERLLAANYELAIKYQDIPKARADILTAGLRNNAFLFVSASDIPYQSYSPQRPGSSNYDITLIQPVDISGKHANAVRTAQQAKEVLEALYQDAVRLEIDKLYTAFADMLEAREAVRAARSGVAGMEELTQLTRNLVRQGLRAQPELTTAQIRQTNAQDALRRTEAILLKARQNLAVLLAVPAEQAENIGIRGTLRHPLPALPRTEELIELARQLRPDLAAYRLGIERARAEVRLAQADGIGNAFLFGTPYTAVDYSPVGKQSANGWGMGVLLPVPLLNRNQGNIARARINVKQAEIEQKGLELQIVREVQDATADYDSSRASVERYEREILPDARTLRADKQRLYEKGQVGLDNYLEARKEYNEVVRDYLEVLARHRRNAFKLNTAVGQRIVP
jgi:cobalt-zinc-cadmium efflux system outer membrane protein